MVTAEATQDYIARYRHKASLLAVIHSRLANKNSNRELVHTFAIVVLTGLITFLGFIGTDRILDAFGAAASSTTVGSTVVPANIHPPQAVNSEATNPLARKATFDFLFNLGVLLLFVASLLNLIFRWKERYTAHFSGVVKLRQFIGWLDELTLLQPNSIDVGKLKHIRHKYESIVELLPPNSDKDYKEAKENMKSDPKEKAQTHGTLDDEQLIIKIIRSSPATMEVLRVIHRHSEDLWLGGGSIRTLAWNYLTGQSQEVHDYDIVYFKQLDLNEETDKRIEAELKAQLPRSLKISVKNQARMHTINGEPIRSSLEDAIANWPETATATAVRLDDIGGNFISIAPYGFEDILNLVVRPTPYHLKNPVAFNRRLSQKDWQKNWPELDVQAPQ